MAHRRVAAVLRRPPALSVVAGLGPTLVIFDCDGVLLDSEAIAAVELARALTALGLAFTAQEAMASFRGHALARVTEVVVQRLGHEPPAGWLEGFQHARDEAYRTGLTAVDGAAQAVCGVRAAGLAVCVASQAGPAKIRLVLALTGLDRLLDDRWLFSATEVAHPKPAPDLFLHAAATMGHAPGRCVVVEDGVLGTHGARAAGMAVLGYAADGGARELEAAGAQVFSDMREVPRRVQGLV